TDDEDRVDVFSPAGATSPARTTRSAYEYREDFHSVYLTLGRKLGALGLQAGVRAEHAGTSFRLPDTGESFDNEYTSLFPSANLTYDFGQGRQARLNYSKRIERPWPFFLNPRVPSPDPLNRMVGNPSLRPKYTHSLSMDLGWTGPAGTLRLAPYYRWTVDNWEQIRRVDEAGVATHTWENVASIESYGTTLSASLRSTGRVGGSASLSGYRELRDASNLSLDYSSDALRWSANANLTVKVTQQLNLQSMVRYNPPRDVPQGRYSATLMTSFGARQQLPKNRGWVNFSVTDPFNLWRSSFESRDRTFVQTGRNRWTMRMATLSFTYSFGRPPQETRRRSPESAVPSPPEGGPPVP
ncbi:MAG TPA: outer membrane beta-barrel family protein, partial [Longimicrobiaceae bacterium]|nr:outer membrane beta-barrel family protein [Longimicrobiaceae bacterium]